jgi:hypothetical protein
MNNINVNDHHPKTIKEIATRIYAHLKRFEADPTINAVKDTTRLKPYFQANAYPNGRYLGVSYISFQGVSYLTKAQAADYLAALDSGFVGTHWQVPTAKAGGKPMSAWQPIETAPKDGTELLLHCEYGSLVLGAWQEWEEVTGPKEGWLDNGEGFTLTPTHWMPLPAPPEAQEANR